MELDDDGEFKNGSKGSFRLCKSGVASILHTITEVDVAKNKWNKAITMGFVRNNPSKPKHCYMWHVSSLLTYLKEFKEEDLQISNDPE
jgi:hypothetical protein